MPAETSPTDAAPEPGLVTYTNVMYGLHALAALIGIASFRTIVGSFVFGLPSIVAIIMNYVRRSETRGTYLESHFRWQRRTFWFALGWIVAIALLSAPLFFLLVGFITFPVGIAVAGAWVVYRVARGWLALREGRPLPQPAA